MFKSLPKHLVSWHICFSFSLKPLQWLLLVHSKTKKNNSILLLYLKTSNEHYVACIQLDGIYCKVYHTYAISSIISTLAMWLMSWANYFCTFTCIIVNFVFIMNWSKLRWSFWWIFVLEEICKLLYLVYYVLYCLVHSCKDDSYPIPS